MPIIFTNHFLRIHFLKAVLLNMAVCCSLFAVAQKDSTTTKIADSSSNASKTAVRSKDIVKLEDVNIPAEMFAKIKAMKPNQMVAFREDYTYNMKAEDNIEYSITIKLGFSQDMITGIIRWVPLYSSNSAPPEITQIKIPIKFCCTTKIDTMHKKQHCGKMSELNDFEDYEHCKDWIQMEDAGKGDKAAVINKKGGKGTGKDSTGFGKPDKPLSKKEMKKKKGKNGTDEEDATDSTGARRDSIPAYGKPEKISKKEVKKKGKERPGPTDSTNYRPEPPAPDPAPKEEKKVEEVKKDSADGGGFGKPAEEKKSKKKKKDKDKKEPTDTSSSNFHDGLPLENIDKEENAERYPIPNHLFFGELEEQKIKKKK